MPYDKFLLTGKTKDTLKRNVTNDLMKIIGECDYNAHLGELTFRVGNETRVIYCIGAIDERSASRVQGGTFGCWYADEVTIHPENFIDMSRTRISVPGSRIYWTCNPDSPYHTIYKDYIEKKNTRSDLYHIQFEIEDNPSLTEEYKNELKNTYNGIFYRRLILGEWVLAEGIVYDSFSVHHIVKEVPEIVRYWVGVDYGTASTTVYLLFGLGIDGKIYVLKEWYHDAEKAGIQLTDPELVAELGKFVSGLNVKIFVDPSASSFILELKKSGYTVIQAENDVLDGIKTVSSGFYKYEILIHESCKTLITEISNHYVWDEKAKRRGEDKPLKKNDHRADALRYGIYSYKKHSGDGVAAISQPSPNKLVKRIASTSSMGITRIGGFNLRDNLIRGDSWLRRKFIHLQ